MNCQRDFTVLHPCDDMQSETTPLCGDAHRYLLPPSQLRRWAETAEVLESSQAALLLHGRSSHAITWPLCNAGALRNQRHTQPSHVTRKLWYVSTQAYWQAVVSCLTRAVLPPSSRFWYCSTGRLLHTKSGYIVEHSDMVFSPSSTYLVR